MKVKRLSCLSALAVLSALMATAQLSSQTSLGITAQGTASQGNVEIANTGSVRFQNNASFPVSITFTTSSGAVLSNIATIAAGAESDSQAPQQLNVTVD